MTPKLQHRARVLKTIFPECYQEVDGYWVWFPKHPGAWGSAELIVIAELLTEANRTWDNEVAEYFGVDE